VFFEVFLKILPLYFTILLGFIAGKALKTDRATIANFLLYIISPIVVLNGLLSVQKIEKLIFLPFVTYFISCCLCWIVYEVTVLFFSDNLRNIIAFSSGSSNTGHFGLPIAMMLVDTETVGIYILAYSGVILFENTYGFYIAAKGNFPAIYCIKRTLLLPTLHAILIAFAMKALSLNFAQEFDTFFVNLRGAYVTLGMATIGLGLSTIKRLEIDWKCISITLVVKYVLWPILTLTLIYLDAHYCDIFNDKVHNAMLILSIVPISVSTMVVGSVLNYPAEKLAVVVLLNTLAGMIYIPIVVQFLL
jgi:predicted permease